MKNSSKVVKAILDNYEPIKPRAALLGAGAQIVNGQWYLPKWGCDTLQHILDELEKEDKSI